MSFEILTDEQLTKISGKKRKSAQVMWFKHTFGIEPITRADGSIIMTQAAFEALMLKRLGVAPVVSPVPVERPALRPVGDKRKSKANLE
ncbi:DUF4224 domain-containing protein [Burkholderia orbicola]|uniref:DUF4224 domain-containing protein n=1 Tax=Burkholderia orbicola TaxID=2978683 RepID=UPI00264BBAD7|nr:DUF4224 domain-containing protein [Burkholderia orbicola]MDN7582962.1 DUF4224 domain-containing protein [Burkholderia orbicola]